MTVIKGRVPLSTVLGHLYLMWELPVDGSLLKPRQTKQLIKSLEPNDFTRNLNVSF